MIHLIQIDAFRLERISIETNYQYKPDPKKTTPPSKLEFGFEIAANKENLSIRRIYVNLNINQKEEDFLNAPYRISLRAGLQIRFPDNTSEEDIIKHIEFSGFHLLWTTLRAYLMNITSMCASGEYVLSVVDLSSVQEKFKQAIRSTSQPPEKQNDIQKSLKKQDL